MCQLWQLDRIVIRQVANELPSKFNDIDTHLKSKEVLNEITEDIAKIPFVRLLSLPLCFSHKSQ